MRGENIRSVKGSEVCAYCASRNRAIFFSLSEMFGLSEQRQLRIVVLCVRQQQNLRPSAGGGSRKKMSGNDGNCEAGLRGLFRFVAFLPGAQVDEQTGKKVDSDQS